MGIYKIKKVDNGVRNINELAVSEFLIEGKDKILLVDTGMDIFNIKKYVEAVVPRKKELMVVNTHFHPDHSNGNHKFKEVYIGEKDVPFEGKLPYDELVENISGAIYSMHPIATLPLRPIMNKLLGTKKGKTKYIPLHDGDKIELGKRELTVRELPGHTNGSIVLLDATRKTIYTGDAVNMATWLFTNPGMKFSEYTSNLEAFYADVKKQGYKTLRCSHTPFPNGVTFIRDYAKFINKIQPGAETFGFNVPGTDSKLCIKIGVNIRHGLMSCFYFENQIG